MSRGPIDPRARVIYLAATAVGVLCVSDARLLGAAVALQLVLGVVVGLSLRELLGQITRLGLFAAVIVLSYALTSQGPELDRWVELQVAGMPISVNVAGAAAGAVMLLRLVAVVLASQIARAGDTRAIAVGLRTLHVPGIAATSIDTVLALVGDGPGSGSGSGGGRRRAAAERGEGGAGPGRGRLGDFWRALVRMGRGDVEPLLAQLDRQIARAQAHASELEDADAAPLARDVGVIAGIAVMMLGIRALRILPAIPFAPGHKLVLLTPLYVVAAMLTRRRLGATLTGASMGTVSFLMGYGRYGVFEIAKHVAPGLVCDFGVPVMLRSGRVPGGVAWTLFGGLIAIGRFGTIFLMTWFVQAPAVAYAILVPGLTVHVTFGCLSGYVTHHFVRRISHRTPEPEGAAEEASG